MQFVFNDSYDLEIGALPPNPMQPEGSITLMITERKSGFSVLVAIPKLQALQVGRRIVDTSAGASNGRPEIEPVYGREAESDDDVNSILRMDDA